MTPLAREHRRLLESTIRKARQIAEAGAKAALEQLAVGHHEPHGTLTPEQRKLRNDLRAHGRQLGDRRDAARGNQAIDRLTTECAYEHWHRMLFARYLAEAELLIEPESGVAISLNECHELARANGRDWLELAAEYAQRMLPQIFRIGDPVLEVGLPPETRSALEDLMKALPSDVFLADDSLGWVYQYWQADRKEAVNRSENKIGADELPAVTQLFTEDYMVFFLLHNTLGAWWAGKVLAANPALATSAGGEDELRAACTLNGVDWKFLRFVRDADQPWRPAAGTFDGWPNSAKDITLLDPSMGSGHFLVFALPMFAALRMAEERISLEAATLAVLRDNLFGLEIDPRCTQIAAFNLALAAWRRIGYRTLPMLNLACSGLSLGVTKAEWLKLAEHATAAIGLPPKIDLLGTADNLFSDAMKRGFEGLYELFARAPWLGSLIDPRKSRGDLVEQGFADLEPVLAQVMAISNSAELSEMAVAAQGVAKAAEILSSQFTLVATNVPYLGRGKQDDQLKDYCAREHAKAKGDLATSFVERCTRLSTHKGSMALVTPQNWWFLSSYTELRKDILGRCTFKFIATLGEEAWQSFGDRGPVAVLMILENLPPDNHSLMAGIDALPKRSIEAKVIELANGTQSLLSQAGQVANPDHRIIIDEPIQGPLLEDFATSYQGISPADLPHFGRYFWEIGVEEDWKFWQGAVEQTKAYGGRQLALWWNEDLRIAVASGQAFIRGESAWGKAGVACRQMRDLACTLYSGEVFDTNTAVIVPARPDDLPAIWAYCSSDSFAKAVRRIDKKINVTNASVAKIPFDRTYWQRKADERFPNGLPTPSSNDPSQWLFSGHPSLSDAPLQVAVSRIVGYKWPRQAGVSFQVCPALDCDGLDRHAHHDGIVTLNPVKGEQAASDRLLALLADAFGAEWSAAKLASILAEVGFDGKTLDEWLRDGFFEQHCALFHQRPFVWHVWDGRHDGFHALVNYHRLAARNGEGRRTLELLLYTYLGDWIDRQRADQKVGVEGADARVAASEQLQSALANILAGEPPFDIFVRWKSLADHPIGWEPDINDGIRMNIRPFMAAKPLGARAKDTCILRVTPTIKWDKDRGKESVHTKHGFPWFWGWKPEDPKLAIDFAGGKLDAPDGLRWNNLHYTRAFKEAARAKAGKG